MWHMGMWSVYDVVLVGLDIGGIFLYFPGRFCL